ncbi:MAG: malto-oligosyltrehalose trehalohydrolase, partial [Acidobacteria bacterium]|nr:malto-oligosyltrehalose trehalohydrolase [Acidobacteriota bacterium]
ALQTHDQVGNRAFGERLHALIDLASWRAASVLLLLAPQTPLLFMGQEWAASSPFLYFTDHHAALGEHVTRGRRQEFRRFARFADRDACQRIPDPQRPETFECSRLRWEEIERQPHAGILRLYRRLLALRARSGPPEGGHYDPGDVVPGFSRATILDEAQGIVAMRRDALAAIICLRTPGGASPRAISLPSWGTGEVILDTEDPEFCSDPCPAARADSPPTITFQRPGAIVIRARSPKPEA